MSHHRVAAHGPGCDAIAPYATMTDTTTYAALLPDEPRWVDTRGVLLCWPATVIEGPDHAEDRPAFVVVSELWFFRVIDMSLQLRRFHHQLMGNGLLVLQSTSSRRVR